MANLPILTAVSGGVHGGDSIEVRTVDRKGRMKLPFGDLRPLSRRGTPQDFDATLPLTEEEAPGS
jgi:hypothetical protein